MGKVGFKKDEITEPTKDIRRKITSPTQMFRITTDMARYKVSVQSAENIYNHQRYQLYQIYEAVEIDSHYSAVKQQRKNLTLSRNFCVFGPDGEVNEEKTKLIRTKWFREYLDLCLDSIFWGHSLIQFDSLININNKDEFKDIYLVPRMYVKPEYHIVTSDYAAIKGTDYLDFVWRNWLIGVGKPHDLGLLMKIAPLQIWKKNAMGTWAEFIEKFGLPIRVGKTNVRDEATRFNMEKTLRDMSVGLYAVIDPDDEIEIKEGGARQDAFEVFDKMIERCNSEMTKLILGQTGTTDEKSFVGSAEVQERVLYAYAELDEHMIDGINNYQLIPMLNAHGFGLEGMTIGCEDEDEFTALEHSKFDIELIKSGKYKLSPEYIKENYGTDVEEVEEPEPVLGVREKQIKNQLIELYP